MQAEKHHIVERGDNRALARAPTTVPCISADGSSRYRSLTGT